MSIWHLAILLVLYVPSFLVVGLERSGKTLARKPYVKRIAIYVGALIAFAAVGSVAEGAIPRDAEPWVTISSVTLFLGVWAVLLLILRAMVQRLRDGGASKAWAYWSAAIPVVGFGMMIRLMVTPPSLKGA